MASHVLSSNYRLGNTTKLWLNNTKKKHRFKVLKLNLFFNSFLYYYLMLLNSQILFSYFYYFNLLSWYIDLFVFRGVGDVFTRKERKARFRHIWDRQKFLFHKVRRPYSIKLHQFILTYMNGYIQKQRFNNKLLLGKLKTSTSLKKKDFIKDWKLISKKLKTISFFKRRFFLYKRNQILRKFMFILLRKKAIFSKSYQKLFFRKPKIMLKTFLSLRNKQSFNFANRNKINILFLQKRLKVVLNSWKYKKRKKLIWRVLKSRIFIKKPIKNKIRTKIFLKNRSKISLKKLSKTSLKKLNKTFLKKKKITKRKRSKTIAHLRVKNRRSLINPSFLKYILPATVNPIKFSKLLKINLAHRSRGYVKRLKLSSKILPIKEIEDWEKNKLKRPIYLKKIKQALLTELKNWNGNGLLPVRRSLQMVKRGSFFGKFKYNISVAKKKHLIFLKKLYKRKLISVTKPLLFFNNYKTVFSFKKKYTRRKITWHQRNIQILKKQKKDSYYCISAFKKLKLKYYLPKNFKIKVVSFEGGNWKYRTLLKQRVKWLASKNFKLKKKKYYCLKRQGRFFLYNFQQSFSKKKTFWRESNLRKKLVKRSAKYLPSRRKTLKADIFYHWFWGFRRFQRIHKMIGNVSKYKEFFFRNFKSAREMYCLRYMRPKSSTRRFSNLLDQQIKYQKQLLKLFFFFINTKKSFDKKNLFFASRLREYNFFLKKLYFNIKQKRFWLVVYQTSKIFLKHKFFFGIKKTNEISQKRNIVLTHSKLFNLKVNICKSFGLSFIKLFLKKNYLKINFFLVFKKKKFFLLKYLNLIYSLKLSSLFLTTIHCFFISCILLFSKNERIFKDVVFDKLERYSNFRRLPSYLTQRFGFIFLLSLKFKQFFLFLEYIKFLFLKYSRKQFIIMTFYKLFLRSNFFNYLANVVGFQFSLKGKMNRRPRARRILFFKKNRPAFQRLNLKIHYYAKQFTNYFGTFTVKFWLYYY